jgi:hypothetical protein
VFTNGSRVNWERHGSAIANIYIQLTRYKAMIQSRTCIDRRRVSLKSLWQSRGPRETWHYRLFQLSRESVRPFFFIFLWLYVLVMGAVCFFFIFSPLFCFCFPSLDMLTQLLFSFPLFLFPFFFKIYTTRGVSQLMIWSRPKYLFYLFFGVRAKPPDSLWEPQRDWQIVTSGSFLRFQDWAQKGSANDI